MLLFIDFSGKSRLARAADRAPVGIVELLGGKGHFRHGKVPAVRVDVPGILERVQIDAVAVFAVVFVFNVAGISKGSPSASMPRTVKPFLS